MIIDIPGTGPIEIKNILLDYNGTLAIDGKLISGVSEALNRISTEISVHVITADTFGSVENELKTVNCVLSKIPETGQDQSKLEYLRKLGKDTTLCVGNGRNDLRMLKEAVLGIVLVQEEGACTKTVLAADIVCRSVLDVFAFFENPARLKATLRN